MDVLITMLPPPYLEGSTIWVPFTAVGRLPDGTLHQVYFRVAYAWGATLAQKRTAILNAAQAARQAYEAGHGVTLPAVDQIEILGI